MERGLVELGWCFLRHGGSHDLWTDGTGRLAVPRHREIAGRLARVLLAEASGTRRNRHEV